ncbi:MAG: ribosomal protein S18-alanine N-acetyltransferase [Dehalococcoidales bacterium]|nr:ribosomal protein S18-alanine N-acetyltransferase [Dehalococcoidales bacterium]
MSYHVRSMRKEDVAQVGEIDREAFSSQWPPPDYHHELRNQVAHYIVAIDGDKPGDVIQNGTAAKHNSAGLFSRLRRLFNHHPHNNELNLASEHVTGFVGFWAITDEAHITGIAVREAYRRRGIGELLMISTINLATELEARTLTLEVRASNTAAQALYTKYGFKQVGVRRGYYVDNKEDGLLMSTQDITTTAYRKHFHQLRQEHSRKYGAVLYQIIR